MTGETIKFLIILAVALILAIGFYRMVKNYNSDGDKCEHGQRNEECDACMELEEA